MSKQEDKNLRPGMYTLKNGDMLAFGRVKDMSDIVDDSGISGIDFTLSDYYGKNVSPSPVRFYGGVHPELRSDFNNDISMIAELRTAIVPLKDKTGAFGKMQVLTIWQEHRPFINGRYDAYIIEEKDGRKSLISR